MRLTSPSSIVRMWLFCAAGCDMAASVDASSKRGKVDVQGLCQRGVTFSSCKISPGIGDVLDSLPHLPAVVAVQVFLYPPRIVLLGRPDASLQVSTCCAVECPVTGPESGVPLLQQAPPWSPKASG